MGGPKIPNVRLAALARERKRRVAFIIISFWVDFTDSGATLLHTPMGAKKAICVNAQIR